MEKSIDYLWYMASSMICFDVELVSIVKFSLSIIKNYYCSGIIESSPIYQHTYHEKLVAIIAYKISLSLLAQKEEIEDFVPEGIINLELRVKAELFFLLNNFVPRVSSIRNIHEEFAEIQTEIKKASPPSYFLENLLNSPFKVEKSEYCEYTNIYVLENKYSCSGNVHICDYPLVNYQVGMLRKLFNESIGREMKKEMEDIFYEQFEKENLNMTTDMYSTKLFFAEIVENGNDI